MTQPATSPVLDPKPASRNPVRRLYDWMLSWAHKPGGSIALFGISFAESSFFPLPPDPLLLALALGKPKHALKFGAICTAGSVLGGMANMPGGVPRTSTLALTNATLPYALQLANKGWRQALRDNGALLKGLNMVEGQVTYRGVAEAFDLDFHEPASFLD